MMVSFGLTETAKVGTRFGCFEALFRVSTAMRFLDEDATSESNNLVSTVKVERLASILDPLCSLG